MKLEDLNPTDGGAYFLITCPSCGRHEAFVYKDDIEKAKKDPSHKIKWKCNRLNKCGASGTLEDVNPKDIPDVALKKNSNLLTQDQIYSLQSLCSLLVESPVGFSIRGISKEVLSTNDFIYFPKGFQGFMKAKYGDKLQKKFCSPVYGDRDILLPIFGKGRKVERILLRSKDKKLNKKEIQVKVTDKATEIWNKQAFFKKDVKYIFMCEGVYDALSILEVAKEHKEIDAIALSGCAKFKKAFGEMKNIPSCKGKKIILCLDNDEAGARELKTLRANKTLRFGTLNLRGHKDVNDFLQEDPAGLKAEVLKKKIM